MAFISYSQNFEDLMLWRALKQIENGFYIDVGAAWPDTGSVTKAFYNRGWSGINIEPNEFFYKQLLEKRPRDINLKLALGNQVGVLPFFIMSNPGLSTSVESIANQYNNKTYLVEDQQQTPITTLVNIYKEYDLYQKNIHFLKIDVEGMEKDVLEGNDWNICRPWIIVLEATLPMTTVECHQEWEQILLSNNYQFVYADGLNRFYVAKEHAELISAFKYPPNVWDNFLMCSQEAEIRAQKIEIELNELHQKIQEIHKSLSWQITKPLRVVSKKVSSLRKKLAL